MVQKCVNATTDSNNQRLFTIEVYLTLLQILTDVSASIATKRKQLSASEYPAAENGNIPSGNNDIMKSSEESHSQPFENEEFRQLCEMKRKKRSIVIARNDNAACFLQKVRYMHLGKMKECFSY